MLGQPQEAKVSMERAIASAEKTYGPEHMLMADLLESDAVVLDKLKLKREARQARDRARTIRGTGAAGNHDGLTWIFREPMAPKGQVYLQWWMKLAISSLPRVWPASGRNFVSVHRR